MAKSHTKNFPLCFVLLVLGISLLFLAALEVISSYSLIPGNAPVKAVGYGQEISEADLEAIILSRSLAMKWSPDPRVQSDLALAKILQSEQLESDAVAEKKALLKEAEALLLESLGQKPADPYAWTRLGYVKFLLEGPNKDVADALKLSFLTGPHEPPKLVFMRLKLALVTMDYFAPEDIQLIEHQIRFSWKRRRQQTAYLAAAYGMEDFFLEAIELTDPGGQEAFLNYIKKAKNIPN